MINCSCCDRLNNHSLTPCDCSERYCPTCLACNLHCQCINQITPADIAFMRYEIRDLWSMRMDTTMDPADSRLSIRQAVEDLRAVMGRPRREKAR